MSSADNNTRRDTEITIPDTASGLEELINDYLLANNIRGSERHATILDAIAIHMVRRREFVVILSVLVLFLTSVQRR